MELTQELILELLSVCEMSIKLSEIMIGQIDTELHKHYSIKRLNAVEIKHHEFTKEIYMEQISQFKEIKEKLYKLGEKL